MRQLSSSEFIAASKNSIVNQVWKIYGFTMTNIKDVETVWFSNIDGNYKAMFYVSKYCLTKYFLSTYNKDSKDMHIECYSREFDINVVHIFSSNE